MCTLSSFFCWQYKAFEAEQQRKLAATADKGQQRRKLEEQEDLSIEQQMAQQYRAFEKKKQAEEEAERQRKKLAAQEDASIEQQMAQQVTFLTLCVPVNVQMRTRFGERKRTNTRGNPPEYSQKET